MARELGAGWSYRTAEDVFREIARLTPIYRGLHWGALLPNGLVCRELHPTATRIFSVFTRGLKIAAPGKYGFYAVTEHGN